ncbi:PDDEXK nuclease domain-containing protein [Flavobacterium sp.]|uniref:PDDEXK nuclease domain-containing protein n=1 Tax=Flavobacterium sp. TaxID=239 RepID=UPI002632ACD7|nr:PDDEXK nuclease domain-containing protein [Flavobacterium sp.]
MKYLSQLISTINDVHIELQASAANAVNKALTVRNWLIGYYIVEYEQNGEDRAEYGANLLNVLASKISIKGLTSPELSRCRQFYQTYSYFLGTLSQDLIKTTHINLLGTMSQELISVETDNFSIRGPLLPELTVPPKVLLSKLSYSHLIELLKVSEPLKRTFYEIECIKGTWSVRELKRQIASLYFERSGLSQNPEKLAELVQQKTKPQQPRDIIKNIYAFEFLDIGINSIVEESDLETALLNNLQQFIIELGNGFCLEARQKRILIGETYYFIDLVFYHRILKCHVLVDLKIGAFDHGDIGQLNTYLNFFKAEITETNDNAPVGILLVAEKDHALVKYATAGMDENLFVQQYLVKLPSQEQLVNHLETELKHFRNE